VQKIDYGGRENKLSGEGHGRRHPWCPGGGYIKEPVSKQLLGLMADRKCSTETGTTNGYDQSTTFELARLDVMHKHYRINLLLYSIHHL